ncbi:hypothetical protein KAR91_16420 [Candidatus Pacearchaeota archaeon]|nr:hypothetical protein [Candidatus Pacearchaeota archaeon]
MKKGELMTGQIVGFILLVVSFIILIWIYSNVAFPGMIDETVCHESVVLRATLGAVTGETGKSLAPLQCKTKKICLGGDCEEFDGAENVLNVEQIDDDRDIEKEIAQEMVSCWTMMGEGKVGVFSSDIADQFQVSNVESTCVVCARIAVNEEAVKDKVDMADVNPMDYMFRHKVPGREISYYEFFSGDSQGASVQEEFLANKTAADNNAPEVAIVFMQADAGPKGWDLVKNDMIAVLGAGIVSKQVGGSFIIRQGIKAVGGTYAAVTAVGVAAIIGGVQTYNVYNNEQIIAGYCGDISLGEKQGCSVVRAIPYNVESLKQHCGYIESIA